MTGKRPFRPSCSNSILLPQIRRAYFREVADRKIEKIDLEAQLP